MCCELYEEKWLLEQNGKHYNRAGKNVGIVKLLKNKLQTQDVDMISCLFIAFCIRRAFIKLHWT